MALQNLKVGNEAVKIKAACLGVVVAVGLDSHAGSLEDAVVVTCEVCEASNEGEHNEGAFVHQCMGDSPQVGSET